MYQCGLKLIKYAIVVYYGLLINNYHKNHFNIFLINIKILLIMYLFVIKVLNVYFRSRRFNVKHAVSATLHLLHYENIFGECIVKKNMFAIIVLKSKCFLIVYAIFL